MRKQAQYSLHACIVAIWQPAVANQQLLINWLTAFVLLHGCWLLGNGLELPGSHAAAWQQMPPSETDTSEHT